MSPPCQPGKVAPISKLRWLVSGPGLLDPPESTSSEMDSDQIISPILEARRLHSAVPEGADGSDVLMTMPKVVRTYTRKIAAKSPVREDSLTSSPSRSSVHERVLLEGHLDDAADTPIEYLASKENRWMKHAKKRTSAGPRNRRKRILQDDEGACQEDRSEDGANTVMSVDNKTKRKKRKKRRAPVNQLALVARAPSHESSRLNAQVRTSLLQDHLLWVSIMRCVLLTC